MRVALYVRVSTQRQAQTQSLEQQLERLHTYAAQQGWSAPSEHMFRDDGYSGASLKRPGLDQLRDLAAARELDLVLSTAPDRLARNYVHQGICRKVDSNTLLSTISSVFRVRAFQHMV